MLTAKPQLRIVGTGARLRVRQKGDWHADPSASLREPYRASIALDKALAEAIGLARASGMSWTDIGRVLGVAESAESKQALIAALAENRRAVLAHLLGKTA
jgi:hypothetical protein